MFWFTGSFPLLQRWIHCSFLIRIPLKCSMQLYTQLEPSLSRPGFQFPCLQDRILSCPDTLHPALSLPWGARFLRVDICRRKGSPQKWSVPGTLWWCEQFFFYPRPQMDGISRASIQANPCFLQLHNQAHLQWSPQSQLSLPSVPPATWHHVSMAQ